MNSKNCISPHISGLCVSYLFSPVCAQTPLPVYPPAPIRKTNGRRLSAVYRCLMAGRQGRLWAGHPWTAGFLRIRRGYAGAGVARTDMVGAEIRWRRSGGRLPTADLSHPAPRSNNVPPTHYTPSAYQIDSHISRVSKVARYNIHGLVVSSKVLRKNCSWASCF